MEYDLVCDVCGKALAVDEGVVSWNSGGRTEHGFAMTHASCVPPSANAREEVRQIVWPNGFLRFATERYAHDVADADALRAIVWALAPFVMRHDNPAEMDGIRAASFGATPGVKPGTTSLAPPRPATRGSEVESGK